MSRKYRKKFQQKTLLNIINEAKTLYDRKLFTDVTLQCEGQEFPTHKVILVANSPYFREYFIQNENIGNVTIDFMTSEVLQIILDYFYSGRIIIDQEQTLRLLKSILEVSSVLEIPLLSNYCLGLILNKQSSDLSLSDWKVIQELNSKVVFEIYLQNIVKKLNLLNTTQDFLQLSVNQINVLFQCPAVAECDQNIVLQSLLNWIKYDLDERKEQLTQFLEALVNWNKLNPAFLVELENEPLLSGNVYFLKSFFKLICQQKNTDTKQVIKKQSSQKTKKIKELSNEKGLEVKTSTKHEENNENVSCFGNELEIPTISSSSADRIFFIYCFKDVRGGEIRIYLYDYVKDQLDEMIAHPLLYRKEAAVLYHKGNVYTFGNRILDDKGISREVYSYNKETKEWLKKKCMHYQHPSRRVFSYNKQTKQWLKKNIMVNFKSRIAAVELNGYIYLVGGISRYDFLKSVEVYNPATDQWKSVAELPDINDGVPMVAVNDCLYIVLNTKLYKYIPEEDKWDYVYGKLEKYMKGDVCMCRGNDKIFIIKKHAPKSVWIYDPKVNTIDEDLIPTALKNCDGILNLENSGNLEFLVSGNEKWFIYRPPHSWVLFDPMKLKDFQISMLTLISKD